MEDFILGLCITFSIVFIVVCYIIAKRMFNPQASENEFDSKNKKIGNKDKDCNDEKKFEYVMTSDFISARPGEMLHINDKKPVAIKQPRILGKLMEKSKRDISGVGNKLELNGSTNLSADLAHSKSSIDNVPKVEIKIL